MIPTEISADARILADRLGVVPVGEVIRLDTMSDAIGRNIRRARHILYTAIRVAERETGAVFVCEPTIGYRRLSVERVAETVGSTARSRIRGHARRARRTLHNGTKLANDLPPTTQRRIAAEMSSLALLEHIARDRTVVPQDDAPMKPTPVAITARRLLAAIGAV